MAKAIIIPKFGFTLDETEIVRWLVNEGDSVQEGDPLLEVTTDKVNMEVDATIDGIVAGITAHPGDVVPVTSTVAWLLAPGESLPAEATQTQTVQVDTAQTETATPPNPQPPQPTNISPIAQRMAHEHGLDVNNMTGSGSGGRIVRSDVEAALATSSKVDKLRATPAARRIARENNIDLSSLAGSGPNGRIQEIDVANNLEQTQPATLVTTDENVTAIPFDNMRRTIAQRLQASMQQAPHIFFEADVDVTELQKLAERANQRRAEEQAKVNLTALLTKGVASTLKRHPRLNAHLADDTLLLHSDVHMGIAVALENGLVVPVVRDADSKSMTALAQEIHKLADKARSGSLRPDDLAGGTFTISNLGMYGTKRFTAIINPPQVAILAVGAVRKEVVVDSQEKAVICPMMSLTLSVDHRAVDGAVAAQFMADLVEVLEDPMLMSL